MEVEWNLLRAPTRERPYVRDGDAAALRQQLPMMSRARFVVEK
jgi:hypothetical protein